ncbi:MAG TPA: regulatory iron-sulfur-containing complex subunit RicT [Planctomycetaceae bacterium]|nr:regulatory iron-sulfur-containing complex subunit RicT [Planctomycetaceae bacterium]
MSEPELESEDSGHFPAERPAERYVVRYGLMRLVAEFAARGPQKFNRNMSVIVRSSRGVEWGEILCQASERTAAYLESHESIGKILRPVNDEDARQRDEVYQQERVEFLGCREMIGERKLGMQLVDVEHLLGGERLIFYYLAEQRVDFRDLVKALAKRYKTRIEMRQIGVRDEAKLLADYGDCGKPVCCNTHLREMPPVSMKMAKIQKATLDPAKISGRCGRLKCCLRYEYDTYEEYRRDLPKVGNLVMTRVGQGKVIAQEILARKILVRYEGPRDVLTDERDVLTVIKADARTSTEADDESDDSHPARRPERN